MIVNDVTGKRTTDTESGVWLTNVHNESREHMSAFVIFDGTRKLSFWTIKLARDNELGGLDISYRLYEAPYFFEAPARLGYKQIIQALLEHFGDYYGYHWTPDERMRCSVTMEPKFLIPLDAWENGNG